MSVTYFFVTHYYMYLIWQNWSNGKPYRFELGLIVPNGKLYRFELDWQTVYRFELDWQTVYRFELGVIVSNGNLYVFELEARQCCLIRQNLSCAL